MIAFLMAGWMVAAVPAEDADRAHAAVEALLRSGVMAADGMPLFPLDAHVVEAAPSDASVVIKVGGSLRPLGPEDEVREELRRESLMGALDGAGVDSGVDVLVRGEQGTWIPLFPPRPRPLLAPTERPPPSKRAFERQGALAGKRIALSAGHGWLFENGSWRTQRVRWAFTGCGNCRGITEDFFTADLVTNHIIPMLHNMGAEVVVVREPDHSLNAGVLADASGAVEDGAWYAGAEAGGHDGTHRSLAAGVTGSSRVEFTLDAPQARRVALRFVGAGDRTTDAVVRIEHGGGVVERRITQRWNGDTWWDLGAFTFFDVGAVTLLSGSGDGVLDFDAVRVGGGMYETSDKPLWQVGAASWVPWAGAPSSVTSYGDVSIRPAYAEHVDADVYVSIHANASGVSGGSGANGMSIYRYSCQAYSDHSNSDSATTCDDPPGSRALIDVTFPEIINRLRADFDPNFGSRGKRVANFGEVRTLNDMPGILIETAFFDNLENPSGSPAPRYPDNRALHDPRWREAFAYGLGSGLARYFDANAGAPPPRPSGLMAVNNADGTLTVSWDDVEGATGYRVYRSTRGRAFDAGTDVTGTSLTISDLTPYQTYVFRVAGVNANGTALASAAVAARFRGVTMASPARVLLINAYDRWDAWIQEMDNDLQYSVEHGFALAAVMDGDVFFDGASDEAVEAGRVTLTDYRMVDFLAGKDSTRDSPVTKTMQGLLSAFVASGGALLLSGEEVGYALAETSSDPDDQLFLAEVLGATYVEDDADTYQVSGSLSGPFSALGAVLMDDGNGGVYEVVYPDVLAPATGAMTALEYPDSRAAAVVTERVIFAGMPLEAIVPESSRNAVFAAAVAYLLPGLPVGDLDEDGASDACELSNGFNQRDPADGPLDADADGVSNAAECQLGTDPRTGGGTDAGVVVVDAGIGQDAAMASGDAGAQPDASVGVDASAPDAAVVPGGGGDAPEPKEKEQGPFPVPPWCNCTQTSTDGSLVIAGGFALLLMRRMRRRG